MQTTRHITTTSVRDTIEAEDKKPKNSNFFERVLSTKKPNYSMQEVLFELEIKGRRID